MVYLAMVPAPPSSTPPFFSGPQSPPRKFKQILYVLNKPLSLDWSKNKLEPHTHKMISGNSCFFFPKFPTSIASLLYRSPHRLITVVVIKNWPKAANLGFTQFRLEKFKEIPHVNLRTFALIVCAHPYYCARYSCRTRMPRHTSSARERRLRQI